MSATKAVHQLHNGSKEDVAELMEQFGVASASDAPKIFIAEQPSAASEKPPYLSSIEVTLLRPSPSNPRKRFAQEALDELAASIRAQGVMEPLLVRYRQSAKRSESFWFEIITGERRWRAAKLAGLESVPALVRQMDDEAVLDAQIVENLQREDMTPLEEAAAYEARLKAAGDAGHKMSVADLAKRVGKSQRSLYDRLELLKLTPFAREALENGHISAGHAAELVRLKPELQDDAVRVTARAELSVYRLREWLKDAKNGYGTTDLITDPDSLRHAENGRAGAEVRSLTRTPAKAKKLPTSPSLDASHSAADQWIPKGIIKPPFEHEGQLWCCVASMYRASVVSDLRAYRVIPRAEFRGKPTTYNGRALRGDRARNDPKGFYHGIAVKCAGQSFVLCGPPKTFPRDPGEKAQQKERIALLRIRAGLQQAAAPPSNTAAISRGLGIPTLASIERAISGSLPGLRVATLKRARKRGEWIAVLRISAKSGRR